MIAELHAIEAPEERFPFLDLDRPEPTAFGRHVGDWDGYYDVDRGRRAAVATARGVRWRGSTTTGPSTRAGAVFNWGDSRVGNVMYRDFRPIAVLDWEMAAIVAARARPHRIACTSTGCSRTRCSATAVARAGCRTSCGRDDALTEYERLTGYTPRDFEFYTFWNATRYGMISARIGRRSAYFAETPVPDDSTT